MKIVGITGCTTGISQSKMAAESLEVAVEDTEDKIRVEVHGASGTENILEDGDVEEAEAAIVASDISVPTERFEGIPTVYTSVQAAIIDPERLIEEAKKAEEEGREKIEFEPEKDSRGVVKKVKRLFS